MKLSILYRGPLSSCNYACWYCPFAKHAETAAELAHDHRCLERFVDWAQSAADLELGILFTPWGEALVRRWYQQALVRLSHLPHLQRVAIQTNLSGPLDWVDDCDKGRLALWTTFHPGETARSNFVARCHDLARRGVRFSAGVVGLKEHFEQIEALRRELPAHAYLWINAYKDRPDYYGDEEVRFLESIDPLFPMNNQYHASKGRACRAGHSVISVDGDGAVRRCHFIKEPVGNLYEADVRRLLRPTPSPCTNAVCGCHIGYVHMPELRLHEVFGRGVLERVPEAGFHDPRDDL